MGLLHHITVFLAIVCVLLYINIKYPPIVILWFASFVFCLCLSIDYGYLQKKNYWGAFGFVMSILGFNGIAFFTFMYILSELLTTMK